MDWKYYLRKLWYKVIYIICVIVYIVFLDKLNKKLLSTEFDSAFSLIEYNDYEPVKYFIFALLLAGVGLILIMKEYNNWKNEENEFRDIIMIICSVIVICIAIIVIIKFISIPILKALLICACVIFGFVYVEMN